MMTDESEPSIQQGQQQQTATAVVRRVNFVDQDVDNIFRMIAMCNKMEEEEGDGGYFSERQQEEREQFERLRIEHEVESTTAKTTLPYAAASANEQVHYGYGDSQVEEKRDCGYQCLSNPEGVVVSAAAAVAQTSPQQEEIKENPPVKKKEGEEKFDDYFDEVSLLMDDEMTRVSDITGWDNSSLFDDSSMMSGFTLQKPKNLYEDDDEDDATADETSTTHSGEWIQDDERQQQSKTTKSSSSVKSSKSSRRKKKEAALAAQMASALEQNKRVRAERLLKIKERIRLQQQLADTNAKTSASNDAEVAALGQEKIRMHLAFQWYNRCGRPTKVNFQKIVRQMIVTHSYCETSLQDIENLPWTADGSRVNCTSSLVL